jgi:hypothetical protein
MSVTLQRKYTGSWFDPEDSRRLAATLTSRLLKRMKGKRGLFLTLTYDRQHWNNAQELYRQASQQKHMFNFLRRLSYYLTGTPNGLKGRWIRKAEWQDAGGEGWLHYHLIIDWPRRIPHHQLERIWGHGFVHIKRASRHSMKYFAKYMGKAGTVPGWLLMERPRSVKVVAVSPGFWAESRASSESIKRTPPAAYVPLGTILDSAREGTIVRCSESGICRTLGVDIVDAVAFLRAAGVRIEPDGRGRFYCGLHWSRACQALKDGVGVAASGGDPHSLYLNQTSNRYKTPWWNHYLVSLGVAEWRRVA